MKLIPAIDLKNNLVVHAQGGDRNNYYPLATPLFPNAEPVDVINRLNSRYGYRTFYIADLGAITGTGRNNQALQSIIKAFPDFNYWLDAGIKGYRDYQRIKETYPCVPIIASETLVETDLITHLTKKEKPYILTLDFKNQLLLGSKKILQQNQYWPNIVIALSLTAVGGNGPDFRILEKVRQYNHHSRIIIGGGIRHLADLSRIRESKIDMALAATAIYTNQLSLPLYKENNINQNIA